MSQRCWSGSRPVKRGRLELEPVETSPAVTTPKVMWVESSQWWAIGASGFAMPLKRCMKVAGPKRRLARQAGVEERRRLVRRADGCRRRPAP